MVGVDPGLPVLDDDHWSANATTIAGYVDRSLMVVGIHTDEFVYPSRSANFAELGHES